MFSMLSCEEMLTFAFTASTSVLPYDEITNIRLNF